MDISIVVVSYNTAHIIQKTIDSALMQQGLNFEIIVIDNNSPDDNSAEVLQSYGQRIQLILNKENVGAGRAYNQAFAKAKGRYLYILNPDAEFQTQTDLKTVLEYMEQNPQIGLAGTKVLENDGTTVVLPHMSYPYQKHIKQKFTDLPGDIAWVLGASTILRGTALEKVNGFHKDFFLYGDDADMAMRMRKQGYEIGYINNVVVKHLKAGSEHNTPRYAYWVKKQEGLHAFIFNHYSKQDVRRILKKDIRRAKWRMRLLALSKLLFGANNLNLAKQERYRAIYTTSTNRLES